MVEKSCLHKDGLNLTVLQRRFQCGWNFRKVSYDAGGLFLGIVLSEGHEIVVPAPKKLADIFCRPGQSIVSGNGQKDGAAVPQVAFCRHGNGSVCDGVS